MLNWSVVTMSRELDVDSAAKLLKTRLNLPSWAVSIAPWLRGGQMVIRVRVDPRFISRLPEIPPSFEGFEVEVTPRRLPQANAKQSELRA
jgi:hypothetical protein